jgi:hypothetical protein
MPKDNPYQEQEVTREQVKETPKIETTYGNLPDGYKYMDEFYTDQNGNKVYHGKRVNFYPNGMKKTECFYEHGTLNGCVKYDEIGNITSDTRK